MVEQQYQWIPAMRDTYTRRLTRYAQQVEQQYPGILDQITAATPTIAAASPPWCPLPIAAVVALGVPAHQASMVTAIAAWQMAGRHIAHIHPDRQPPPIKHVPLDELQRLPVRCLYLAVTDTDGGAPPYGMFAWLEYDEPEDRTEIRLQIDLPEHTSIFDTLTDPVHVVRGTLRDAVSATQTTAMMRGNALLGVPMPPVGRGTDLDPLIDRKTTSHAHLLAAVAYLSSPQAQIVDAKQILDEDDPQEWTAPRTHGRTPTLWLAY